MKYGILNSIENLLPTYHKQQTLQFQQITRGLIAVISSHIIE